MKKTTSQVASKVRNGASRKQAGAKVSRTMLALEPRFMFDAAGMATAADAASHALPDDAYVNDVSDGTVQDLVAALADHDPAAAQSGVTQQRVEIVFIDTAIKDWTVLRDSVRDGVEVVLLDPTRNGLEQMEQALAGRSDIDALHVFSHGSDGQVELGNFKLNSNNIDAYAETLGRIGATLTSDGDLLLYGCDVASDQGQAFIARLAEATAADVAASRDATGAANVGGNWILEVAVGELETGIALNADAQQAYSGLLAAGTLTFNTTDGAELASVVTDEMGVTADIPGITYQIYTAESASPHVPKAVPWTYAHDLLGDPVVGVRGGIVGDWDLGNPVMVIKSADGSKFDFRGLGVVGYNGEQPRITIEGFRDGVSTGSVTLDIDTTVNWNATFDTSHLTRSVFQNVDEVRLTNPDEYITQISGHDVSMGYVSFVALQNLVFGEPVGAPVVDANGAAGGTTNTTTFTENGPAVRLVTSDAMLTDDDAIASMTLALDATPNGTSETIAYSAALNGGASLAAVGLTGSYDSVTRTYTISGTASAAVYQGVLRGMVYNNSSDAPGTTARTVTISATDAQGTVGQTTVTINIVAVNDAPTATNMTQSHAATEGGATVGLNDIVVTDVDAGDTITATLTLSNSAAGTLSTGTYGSATSTFNVGTGVWTVTGSVADVNAALAAVALTPSANNDQNFTITTRIRDAAGTGPADGTISFTVTPVNDAPVLDPSIDLSLNSINEDAGAPVDGVASGTLISALVGGISDPDADAVSGIAIIGADASQGTWWFTTDGGASWLQLETPSASAARLLAADANTRVHFQPNADWNGGLLPALTIRAWDQTAGSNGGQANINVVGTSGTTPFSSAPDTVTLTVNAVNDAPVATVPGSISVTEDMTTALTGISFSDVDAGSGNVTVMLSVTAGTLDATTGAGVTVGGTASALSMTGTIANINAFIAASNVTYTPASNDNGTRVLTVSINDGGNTGTGGSQSDTRTVDLNISAVNDAPVLTPGPSLPLAGTNENSTSPSTLVSTILASTSVSDADAGAAFGIAITASTGNGTWQYSTNGASWTSVGTVSDSAALLLTSTTRLRYVGDGQNGENVSFTFRAWDRTTGTSSSNGVRSTADTTTNGGSSAFSADTATASMTVTAVNDAPTATNMTQSHTATEGGSAVSLNDIVVTDVDTGDTITATLTLSDPAAGSLSTGTYGSATSTWNAGTGVWTVTGSVADVNAALAAVALTPAANNNQNFTITTRIRDAENTGPADGTISFTITPVNDAPTITAPVGIGVTEDVTSALTGISFSDVDAGANEVTVTLSAPSGTLAATGGSGVTVGGTSSALTLTGTIADLNAFIAASNVTFTTASNATGSVTLTVTIDDGGNSGTGGAQQDQTTVTLTVTAVNDAPQITAPGSIGLTVNDAEALTGISFADVDAGASNVTVTFSVPSGALSATSGGGVTVGGTSSALTLTGTIANLNTFIAASNVTYTTALNATTSVTLTVSINDNGNTGSGGAQQASTTVTLSASDRPVVTIGGGSASYAEDGLDTVIAPGLTITDSDSPTLAGAVVTITDFVSGDELSFINQNDIVGSYNAATGVLTLTGVATVAQYQAALRSIAYASTNDNPATGAGNADRVIEFRVSDGGLQSVAGITQTLIVTNTNDAPVLDAGASPALNTVIEDAAAPVDGSTAGSTLVSVLTGGISDVDSGALQGIAIVGTSEQGTLWYSTNGGLTWTVAPTVSESSALLLASDARLYFQPAADVNGVVGGAIIFRAWDCTAGVNGDTADTSANGGATAFSSEIDTASIAITAVNDAPTINSAPTLSGLEDSVLTIDTDSLNYADVDTGDSLQSITVSGLPTHGTLFLDANDNGVLDGGEAIAAGQVITAGDIDAGRFKFAAAPNTSGAGYASFQYTVSDGIASSTPATAVIDILPVNDAPTATNLTQTVTYVEDAASVALGGIVVADIDTDDTIIATLTLSNVVAGSLSTGTFGAATSSYDVAAGVWTVTGSVADVNAALAAVAFSPAANWDQNTTITTRVRDSAGAGPADGSITLNVTPADDAPVATGTIPPIEGRIDRPLHVVLPTALFSDADTGDELTLSVVNLPAGLTFDAATGTISGTPTGEPGEHTVQLVATDSTGATASITFSVRIAAPSSSQPAAPPPWVNMESGSAIVSTPSSGPRTIGPSTAPVAVTLPNEMPRSSFFASPTFAPDVFASDSRLGVAFLPLPESAPAAPSSGSSGGLGFLTWSALSRQGATSIAVQTNPSDVVVEWDLSTASSTKIALPPRTFVAEGAKQITIEASMADGRPLPSWVRFDPREGTFTLHPPKGFEGSLEVRVTAHTEQGQSASAEFKIVVADKGDDKAARGETAQSKPSLSEQLRAAGEDGLLAEAAEFLERLADAAA